MLNSVVCPDTPIDEAVVTPDIRIGVTTPLVFKDILDITEPSSNGDVDPIADGLILGIKPPSGIKVNVVSVEKAFGITNVESVEKFVPDTVSTFIVFPTRGTETSPLAVDTEPCPVDITVPTKAKEISETVTPLPSGNAIPIIEVSDTVETFPLCIEDVIPVIASGSTTVNEFS